MGKNAYQSLLDYALRILGRRSYSESGMLHKLLQRGKKLKLGDFPDAAEVSAASKKVLDRLRELKYVDDDRMLADYFEYRLKSRPVGKFEFLHEMHRRGIPFQRAGREWDRRGIAEEPLAQAFLEKRRRQWVKEKMPPVLQRKKIAGLLAGRGFAPDTVWAILDKYK